MATASIEGTEIYYHIVGEGLPCLVMHGGLGFDHAYLHPWLDPLGDTLQLIYYDHRGNGRSGRPPKETMTHAQFAADAAALADHLGHARVAVLGHSYGGFIALEFALRYPERLSRLVLLDTAPANPSFYADEVAANFLKMGATEAMQEAYRAGWSTDEEMRDGFSAIFPVYFRRYDADVAARLVENVIINADGGPRAGESETYNVTARLGEIDAPSLVLAGRYDWICPPSQAQILHEGLPNSELVIFEESGHLPYVEEPELFFDTVRGWVRR